MGNSFCATCEEPSRLPKNRMFNSIAQMEKAFKKYAQDNLLGLYGTRIQRSIEKLFTLEQIHVCDMLIKLSCQQRIQERDQLLVDIESIDLEKLDHVVLGKRSLVLLKIYKSMPGGQATITSLSKRRRLGLNLYMKRTSEPGKIRFSFLRLFYSFRRLWSQLQSSVLVITTYSLPQSCQLKRVRCIYFYRRCNV